MKRRSFLQQTGLLLAAWGVSEMGLAIAGDRYHQALAQPTSRKLALLIGINQYRKAALNGCLTDVELQRELLIHRFGFQPADILTLTDQQATRSNIETAFLDHLVNQAKLGDVVVFHFSGCGSLINLGSTAEEAQTSLVTIDDAAPDAAQVDNILSEDTLVLLLRSLPTDQVTTILDAGYAYPGASLQGSLRVRSRATQATRLNEAELAFQEKLLGQLAIDRAQVRVQRRSGQFPGVVLAAAGANQLATEARWDGFSAGLFTYNLTQQLWRATPATTLRFSLSQTASAIGQVTDQQQPTLSGRESHEQPLKPYHSLVSGTGADGVVTSVEDGVAQVWLAGLPAQVLERYGVNSLLSLVSDAEFPAQIQITAREGLIAKAKLLAATPQELPQVGQLVQESLRVIPHSVGLSVALDSQLERIERVDAISAFSAIPLMSAAPAGEQAADYLFGKIQEATQVAALPSASIAGVVPPSGYGLFSRGRDVIPSTVGAAGEAVKLAVKRLVPQLQTLLAAKLLSLTENERSSRLGVRATLSTVSLQERVLTQQETDRVSGSASAFVQEGKMLTIPSGSRLQYRIQNDSQAPIYFVLLGLDSSSSTITCYTDSKAALPSAIAPGETRTVPPASLMAAWVVQTETGIAETQLICSRAPFSETQTLLAEMLRSPSESGMRSLSRPLEVAQAVLQDLHQASDSQAVSTADSFALDLNAWATFRLIYQII